VKRILAALLMPFGLSSAADLPWKAGLAKTDITPTESIWMAGYGARTKPSEGVLQKIYVKGLALQNGGGAPSVLVTSDLLGFNAAIAAEIAEGARKRFGVSRDRLLLNSSHTHSGPVTGTVLRPAYAMEKAQEAVVARYTAWLIERVVSTIGESIRNLAPASLSFEQGFAGFAVNRRRVGNRQYPGPVDHDVPVMAVRAPDGALRAVVFGYSCHATVLSDYTINGDWPGYAQEAVERAHPGAAALFMAGCGADANPLPRRSVALAKSYGETLAAAVEQVLDAKMRDVAGPLRTAFEYVDIPFAKAPSRAEFEARLREKDAARARHARYMLDILERDGKLAASYPYPVQAWQFGGSLTLLPLAGEVVVDYALRLRAKYGWNDLWVAGYSNDVFAYIPSLRVLKEGGYEGGGAMIGYGQPGPFAESVEEDIVRKVEEVLAKVGRK
jgi:hypothetical protein